MWLYEVVPKIAFSPNHRRSTLQFRICFFWTFGSQYVFVLCARERPPRTLRASSPFDGYGKSRRAKGTRKETRKQGAENLLAGYISMWLGQSNAWSYMTMCITIVRNWMTYNSLRFPLTFSKKIKAILQLLLMLSNGSSLLQSADSANVSSQFSFNLDQDIQTFKEIKWTVIQYRCRTIISWKNLRLKSALSRFECFFFLFSFFFFIFNEIENKLQTENRVWHWNICLPCLMQLDL